MYYDKMGNPDLERQARRHETARKRAHGRTWALRAVLALPALVGLAMIFATLFTEDPNDLQVMFGFLCCVPFLTTFNIRL